MTVCYKCYHFLESKWIGELGDPTGIITQPKNCNCECHKN